MKIVVVTSLYPTYNSSYKDERVTKAVHNFVKYWNLYAEVLVLRPLENNFNFFSSRNYIPDKNREGYSEIDGVKVICYQTKRVNRTSIYFSDPSMNILVDNHFIPDVVVSHLYDSIAIAKRICKRFSIPMVVGIHNADILGLNIIGRRGQIISGIRKAELIACRSRPILKKISSSQSVKGKKLFICNSGISSTEIEKEEFFKEKATRLTNSRKIQFITASNLLPLKNIDVNLHALAKLQEVFDWEYHIVGDGPERRNLEELCQTLNIQHKVKFYGFIERKLVLEMMKESAVFLMVSAPETFGLAYLEAMAKGCIVIGAYGWGIDGVVIDGENGFLVAPRDLSGLCEKLHRIYEIMRVGKIASLYQNMYETIERMTEEDCAEKYYAAIEAVCTK